ncbi:MAG: hypothetical protein WCO56_20970 [Verrucomicrobiota bacterium]
MDELIQQFNQHRIRYLLIGGQTMRLFGMPRFSMDWDFFIPPRDPENFQRLNQLLDEELREPILPLGPRGENFVQTYQTSWGVIQFHLKLPGVPSFEAAEAQSATCLTEHGTKVKCLSRPNMLTAKEAANRPQDQQDIAFLKVLLQSPDSPK